MTDNLTSTPEPDLNVILLHEGMYDKRSSHVTTSLTMIDLHDIARSARTFGIKRLFIAHPSPAMRKLARTLCAHWQSGFGARYNPDRQEALSIVHIVSSLDEALHIIDLEAKRIPRLVATSAIDGIERTSFPSLKRDINGSNDPFLFMFGTGYGMSASLTDRADYFLEPVQGAGDYNHLSVRSACAIILDRLCACNQTSE